MRIHRKQCTCDDEPPLSFLLDFFHATQAIADPQSHHPSEDDGPNYKNRV